MKYYCKVCGEWYTDFKDMDWSQDESEYENGVPTRCINCADVEDWLEV